MAIARPRELRIPSRASKETQRSPRRCSPIRLLTTLLPMIFEFLEIKRSARSLFGCRGASTGAEKIYGTPDNPIFESINCVRQMFAVSGGDILYLSTALCLNEIYRGTRLSPKARSDCSVRTRGINFCKNAERYITKEKRKVGIEC